MRQIFTFGSYLREKFGCQVHKVGINISGFTCPNIDGTVAKGGCTFCENDSFSASENKSVELKGFYLNPNSTTNPNLDKQLKQLEFQFQTISKRQKENYGAKKFIVYFQSFTNTYAPLETLKTLYEKALSFEGVVGLSIGTRSDSISDETFEYLCELNKKTELWIEFGIQSIFDTTLERINRGHNSKSVENWIKKTKAHGIKVCGHLIFGLPNESEEMMLQTAIKAYEWKIDSVKYHPLYVVKKTALANELIRGEFTPISKESYLRVLTKALELKPDSVSVQRVTAGIDNDSLLAPAWCRSKNSQIKEINRALKIVNMKY